MVQKRVQSDFNVSPEAIRPVAAPVDTAVAARQPAKTNTFLDLAASLETVQPALRGYLDDELKIFQEQQEAQAQRDFYKMSPAEQREAVKAGKLAENNSEFYVNNFNKLAGVSAARERIRDLSTRIETDFDYNTGDLGAFVDEGVNADLEEVTDPNFTSSYLTTVEQGRQSLLDQVERMKAKEFQETKFTNIIDTMWNDAEAVKSGGPKAVAESIRKWYEAGPKMFNIPLGEMDGLVLQIAQRYATDGNEAVVTALVNEPRIGVEGQVIPPLANKAGPQGKAANALIESARTEKEKKQNEYLRDYNYKTLEQQAKLQADAAAGTLDIPNAYKVYAPFGIKAADTLQSLITTNLNAQRSQGEKAKKEREESEQVGQAIQLLDRGQAWAIQDPSLKKKAINAKASAIANDPARDDEQKFNDIVTMAANNGEPYEPFKNLLAAGVATGTMADAKEMPQTFQDGFSTYQKLKAKNVAISSYADSATEQFYEAVAALTETGNVTVPDAWQTVREAFNNREVYDAYQSSGRAKAINDAVDTVRANPATMWADWEGVSNFGAVMSDMQRYAETLGKIGLDKDVAIERAQEGVTKNWVRVNNTLVRKTTNLPQDPNDADYLSKIATWQVEQFKKAHPEYAEDDIEFSPARSSNDIWVFREGGVVIAPGGKMTIAEAEKKYRETASEDERKELNKKITKRNKADRIRSEVNPFADITIPDFITAPTFDK